jgi:hypothetical protein
MGWDGSDPPDVSNQAKANSILELAQSPRRRQPPASNGDTKRFLYRIEEVLPAFRADAGETRRLEPALRMDPGDKTSTSTSPSKSDDCDGGLREWRALESPPNTDTGARRNGVLTAFGATCPVIRDPHVTDSRLETDCAQCVRPSAGGCGKG